MESPSSTRARWPGNNDNNGGLPWAFGKANTGNSVADFSGGGMPGTYPISPETSGSLRNFDPDDPGEETWHDRSARSSLRGTAVSRGSASAASEFVVDIENFRIGVGNNEAGVGTFHAARTASVQQPLPVYHNGITSIHSPIPTRPYHYSNTWSMSDFGRESGEVPRYPVNFSHSRSNALSGVFTLDIPQKTLARVNSTISHHRVTTPDIGIQLAAYAIADKNPGILSYIFGAVKGFFSCIGSRHKDSRPQDIHEDTHDDQTHSMPLDEFVITIDEAEETAREGTISSETELDYASEMERIRNAQMGLANEEERPQSILLPPCPVYVAEQFARPRSKSSALPPSTLYGAEELPLPRSRPTSYPGAPETESIATIRQLIATEMAEGPLDTIDDYASSDIDEYHEVLRNGIGIEVGDYHETLQEIEAAQIRRGDHEEYTPTPKKLKKKGKERLNHLLSPIMDAASSVKTFLSSTISDVHEEDDHDFTPSEDASSPTPTLIRAAIGTSITNACRPAALRQNQDGIAADDVDTPEEIENPKLLELFGGKKPSEEYLRPQTPDAKANYDYWRKEIRYRRRKLVVKEETEDSLYLFDHNMWGDESLGYESPGFDKREIPGKNSPREYSEEEQPEEKGIPEEEVCEEQFIRDSSEIENSDSVIVGDCMTKEDSGNIVAGENVRKANVDEYVKMHHDQLEFEQAFTGIPEEKMVFDAAHPDSDTPDGLESGPSDGRNDFDGCKVLGSPTFCIEDNFDLSPATFPLVERRVSTISAISTTSVISKAEAIKVLRQELHHLGIGSSGDPLIDKLTWTSRHTSIVSVVERPDSFQNLVDLFGDEEESEDDSKKPKRSFGGNSSLFRRDQMANATNVHVPSGMEHISHYFRTAEVRARQGITNESSATFSKEHVGRMSYTHLYDEEDRVASDEEEQEHEKEYKRYYEEQLQLQCG